MLSFAGGVVLGLFFFGGLAWTILRGLQSRRPALIFLLSYLIRVGVVGGGFVLIASGEIVRAVALLVGFVAARRCVCT